MMHLKRLFALACCIALALTVTAGYADDAQTQAVKSMPKVVVKDLSGKNFNTENIKNDGKPIIVSFWATWCKPCILELSTIHDEFPDWQEETGVKLVAISVDDARTSRKVKPFINGRGWEYDVYIDENADLKRAMHVNAVPHTFVLNAQREVVYEHTSYAPGDELKLLEIVRKVKAGEL